MSRDRVHIASLLEVVATVIDKVIEDLLDLGGGPDNI